MGALKFFEQSLQKVPCLEPALALRVPWLIWILHTLCLSTYYGAPS